MDVKRTLGLADLATPKPKGPSLRGSVGFVGAAIAVVGLFAAVGGLAQQWTIWQAESFGDRRLQKPAPAECQIARALVRDHDRAALLRSVGAADLKMELRAFAWHSDGARVPPGMDWRNCPRLGADLRTMGMAGLGAGIGPALYISRAAMNPAGDSASVRETFRAPREGGRQPVVKAWTVELRRAPGGAWVPVRRMDAPLPTDDFLPH
jgi:hypothetical protein